MQIPNRSPQHGRVWLAAMLFRLAWRMTPPSMRDDTIMTYGMDAGLPSEMVLYLRRKRYNSTP
jgi:hypothetical protein